ncbi:hypothetical protein C1H46_001427 [Malus baccata]|uniref:Uncharacterized protein n=1 Tax=Malus baccata TaxID=106549 RepID=A0A540NPU7_MALBA|nr:hypothetical protein C1H46_001427 [Malus baccata]
MNKGISKKRPAPPQPAANPAKQQATSPEEEEFVDEDVFLDETLVETEGDLVLRDIEQRQSLASRLTKWARRLSPMPTLSPPEASVCQPFPILILSLFLF